MANRVPRMSIESEIKCYKLWKLQDSQPLDIQKIVKRPDGKAWSLVKLRRLVNAFKKGYVPELPANKTNYEQELKSKSMNEKLDSAFEKTVDSLYIAASEMRHRVSIRDQDGQITIPLRLVMDAMEKAGKHLSTMAKIKEAESRVLAVQSIDYEKMAQLYIKYKNDPNIESYDAKNHMRAVLDLAHGKKKK